MKEPVNSPLELYEKAYRLHYDEGRIPEACRLYKAIVDGFPDSNECGYAVIQLEKVLAQSVSERINVSSRWTGVLAVISIIVSVCCLVTVILIANMTTKTVNARLSSASLMSQALGKLFMGKDKEALGLLEEAKAASQNNDIAPYLLSADMYLKRQMYAKAMAEYSALRKLPGGETIAKEEMVKAKAEEENATRRPVVVEKIVEDTPALQKPVEETVESPKPESAPVAKEIKPKVKKEVVTPVRPVKPKKTGPGRQDSISFF
jgi:hypothetical protein